MNEVQIVWKNVFMMSLYHLLAFHGIYYIITLQNFLGTFIFALLLIQLTSIGVISGVHRLWTHRTYKARLPLRIFLMLCNSLANQNSIYIWARDHRVHHKFTDTDADPHNISRGFFFAHMGWLLCRKHPDVVTKGKTINMSDLENDPVVIFQKKYFIILAPLISFVIPTITPWYLWGEDWYISLCIATMFRYVYTLHGTWLVNSVAHMWGTKPYDQNINAAENVIVSHITNGEGWHNYHHVFPWDYKAAELDTYTGNLNTAFIDLMNKINMAYDLKTVSPIIIQSRKFRNRDKNAKIIVS